MTIPAELIELPQWVLYRIEDKGGPKPTKVPYSAHTGFPANVTDPASWAPYTSVCNGHAAGYNGPGFCLSGSDGIIAGDLDDPYSDVVNGTHVIKPDDDPSGLSVATSHQRIIQHMDTYTEWSPSRRGFRLFFRGAIPEGWRNRLGKVEFYSKERFLTVTGNHVAGTPLTINDRQAQFEDVARALGLDKGGATVTFESRPQTRDDEQVYAAIAASKVGAAFVKLWNGDISGYPSGSEADQALANYICHFTDNTEQAEKLFRASYHYAGRPKLQARPELVTRTINKGFDKKPPAIDTTSLKVNAEALEAQQQTETVAELPALALPPGLMGWIAQYIYASAPYPIPEVALAGAIGLMGGIGGRAFNVDGAGLNQYLVMIARTGIGKDAMSNGISKLLAEVESTIPAARTFQGPQIIGSAPGLYRIFNDEKGGSKSRVSIIPEFGEWLGVHSEAKADATKRALIAAIMEIYGKSGAGNETGAMAYADTEKNQKIIKSPAFTMLGDTVGKSFYDACTAANIVKGLIPRLLLLEYRGLKPSMNVLAHHHRADQDGLSRLTSFIYTSLHNNKSDIATQVLMTNDAREMLSAFRIECEKRYNEDQDDVKGSVLSRAPLKATKLAALVAVGCNWLQPVIIAENAEWAINLAKRDIETLLGKVDSGEAGVSVETQATDAKHRVICKQFLAHISKPWVELKGLLQSETTADMHDNFKMMRPARLKNLCVQRAAFKGHNNDLIRDKVYADALKELHDVIEVVTMEQMPELREQRPNVFKDWKIAKLDTQLVRCVDVDALRRIADNP